MENPKITLVGAGGMSFGPTMVNDVIHTPELAGSRLMLHDVNEERLLRAYPFASKLNAANGAPVILHYSVDPGAPPVSGQQMLAGEQLLDPLAFANQLRPPVDDHDLGGARTGVVVAGHRHAIGTCGQHGQHVTRLAPA